jgi:uncharacterized membrane protein
MSAPMRPAKRPVTVLAGPYGHPFHPILVTIPIGAWVSSLIFDIVSAASHNAAAFEPGAYWLIGIGVIGALLAAVFGLLDLLTIPRRTSAFRTGITHMSLNLAIVAIFVASFVWRLVRGYDHHVVPGLIVLSVIGIVLLLISGWLGGRLAYTFGVRVAEEEDQMPALSPRRAA